MAKAASPIRLEKTLMQQAATTAKRYHRSTAEQVEYWADIGRSVSSQIDPDVLLSLTSGIVKIKIEPVDFTPINPDDVFDKLEREKQTGQLQKQLSSRSIRYQASKKHVGYLEQIDKTGSITTGKFENGQFIAIAEGQNEQKC